MSFLYFNNTLTEGNSADEEKYSSWLSKVKYGQKLNETDMPYFKTMAYTEFATNFYMQPLNQKLRNEMMVDAFNDNVKKPDDWSSYLINNVLKKSVNKYQHRKDKTDKWPAKDYLVILPGSNKVKTNVCLNRLQFISKQHGNNIYFKPFLYHYLV